MEWHARQRRQASGAHRQDDSAWPHQLEAVHQLEIDQEDDDGHQRDDVVQHRDSAKDLERNHGLFARGPAWLDDDGRPDRQGEIEGGEQREPQVELATGARRRPPDRRRVHVGRESTDEYGGRAHVA